ncbi:UDP-glucose/GDP-mannose dehydrogenase family protein [Bacillus sp. HMF5848]|uniref:UDP-glucose dehydrogenase family protein n=1 Tax=Bacillus sp. HMF5848 TaxID=2495421 RepID=UPI000F78E7DB|nr:nucleotide sugar dehydrogenase [Bacillus sp. HMF5848]RSK28612.1 UDP-glucose/GDP-mannose dehydrogenase family protein [Bacillus sp. HMF5848]
MSYKITVLGLGFVGLTTALSFSEKNHKVFGFDIDQEKVECLQSGKVPFLEPGLDEALNRHLNNNFVLTDNVSNAVKQSDFIFLCVGTPTGKSGEADLKYIFNAIDMFYSVLNDDKYRVVVVKSTVPPGTTSEKITPYLIKLGVKVGEAVSIANNPEFLREGHCWDDMLNADRIVCGVSDMKSESMLRNLYKNFNTLFFAVSLNTGEYTKYLSNTFLATMISYANEMSKIATVIGDIQIKDAFNILHLDRRWGNADMASYVFPGCGFGGYCLPKDTQALYSKAFSKGYDSRLLHNVMKINNSMPLFMFNKIKAVSNLTDSIGILGLSFKPGSDDVRDSSAAKIISMLINEGHNNIFAYDPVSNKNFDKEYKFKQIKYHHTLNSICEEANVLVLVTAWDEFREVNKKYPNKPIIDCRYFL